MRKFIMAVIGANYGDEGKGRVVDYCAGHPYTVVARFNGGAQAGHTVVRDGKRHVFRHFGAGTLRGARTFLCQDFICNPVSFVTELKELHALNVRPTVGVDSRCRVTTPYDMIVNQEIERARGALRHGSCGCGVHETVLRSRAVPLTIGSLLGMGFGEIKETLKDVRDYAHDRLASAPEWKGFFSENLEKAFTLNFFADQFIDDLMQMIGSMTVMSPEKGLDADVVIFEGAQGLGLDEYAEGFPHVTHSRTGLTHVIETLESLGESTLDVVYVTRAYGTRHGAGPLPFERELKIKDETNCPNEWQGKFRTADLDVDGTVKRVRKSLSGGADFVDEVTLAVTCIDQALGAGIDAINVTSSLVDQISPRFLLLSEGEEGTMSLIDC